MDTTTKVIAKNTMFLYFRMILIMLVSLYTVREVLSALGTVDYGIYNVVGGVVTMFGFLSGVMSTASQRFFAFELGRKNYVQLKKIFSITISIYVIIGFVILLLSETIGLWFLNYKMLIPDDRIEVANWVFQFSVFSFIVSILSVPYNALIIAHEKMSVYAYISIAEVLLKLLIVYGLLLSDFDKLKLYSLLVFLVTLVVSSFYRFYCKKKFVESKFNFVWDKALAKEIFFYSGWNLFGAVASVFNNQGLNILMNVFFGPIVNAGRTIAFQVNTAIGFFVSNFVIAARPQITKYYANQEMDKMLKMVFSVSKFAFLLLLLLSMAVLLETEFVLKLWLTDVPQYTVSFTRLVIVGALIDSFSYPLMTAAQATGRVKVYQAVVGGMLMLNLPISYIFLKQHAEPNIVFYISIITSAICLVLRVVILRRLVNFPAKRYFLEVILPVLAVLLFAYSLPVLVYSNYGTGWSRFILVTALGLVSYFLGLFLFGLTKHEKGYVKEYSIKYLRPIGKYLRF